ncbi:MAG: hypothetical protein RDV48_03220 [Candidatus Eremiobacteraeota bacterium]|nr:hypothetical protein [Candidatus Eremiobacteraeota bacterium]
MVDVKVIKDAEDEEPQVPEKRKSKVPWDRLIGVALLGALGSALIYYVFIQLDDEKKEKVKEFIIAQGKPLMSQFFAHEAE